MSPPCSKWYLLFQHVSRRLLATVKVEIWPPEHASHLLHRGAFANARTSVNSTTQAGSQRHDRPEHAPARVRVLQTHIF